jgi:hypothetical protein
VVVGASSPRTGSELAPSSKPQPDRTLVEALARARRWQRLLDEGVYTSISEIGDARLAGITRFAAALIAMRVAACSAPSV